MECVSGEIYAPDSELTKEGELTFQGYICYEDGIIVEMGRGPPPFEPKAKGLIVPAPVNAHTHLGDSFLYGSDLPRTLEELVAPPNGYKHRRLATVSREELLAGIRSSLQQMITEGHVGFLDFREGSVEGIQLLREALNGFPDITPKVLGRPLSPDPDSDELVEILSLCDGFGASAISSRRCRPWPGKRINSFASMQARGCGKISTQYCLSNRLFLCTCPLPLLMIC